MGEQDKPFRYLTQDEFLALKPAARLDYLRRVAEHLEVRSALAEEPEKQLKP